MANDLLSEWVCLWGDGGPGRDLRVRLHWWEEHVELHHQSDYYLDRATVSIPVALQHQLRSLLRRLLLILVLPRISPRQKECSLLAGAFPAGDAQRLPAALLVAAPPAALDGLEPAKRAEAPSGASFFVPGKEGPRGTGTICRVLHTLEQKKGGGNMVGPNILGLLSGLGGSGGILSALGGSGGLNGLAGLGSILGGLGGMSGPAASQNSSGLDLSALAGLASMLGQYQTPTAPLQAEEAPVVDVEPEPVVEEEPTQGDGETGEAESGAKPNQRSRKSTGPKSTGHTKPPLSTEQLLGLLTALGKMAPSGPAGGDQTGVGGSDPGYPPGYDPGYPGGYPPGYDSGYDGGYASGSGAEDAWSYGPGYTNEPVSGPYTGAPAWDGSGQDPDGSEDCPRAATPAWSERCRNCPLSCPRAGLQLPDYQEVRNRAAHWSRY